MQYTIQKGDTLSALAKRFRTTVGALAKRNNIKNVNKIYAGDSLDLPGGETAAVTQQPAASASWSAPASAAAAAAQSAYRAPQTPTVKPYKSEYADRIEAVLKSIDERGDFTYDYADDPLYHNYKDSYIQGGRLAMLDTLGDAAALTGGYGSSYGQSAGQQTYQGYMTALANEVPALEAQAYDKYRREGDALYDRLQGYASLDDAAYDRYRDTVADAYTAHDYAYREYRDERDEELKRYLAELDALEKRQALAYQQSQDALAQQNKERELALKEGKASGKTAAKADGKANAASGASLEGNKIHALFSTMTAREARAMLADPPSVAYIQSVLGEDGYTELKRLYGAQD